MRTERREKAMNVRLNDRAEWEANGYVLVNGLFSAAEAVALREHFMELRGKGTYPGDFSGVAPSSKDPLLAYPRMIHMHRWDDVSLRWLLDPRVARVLAELEGVEAFAVQTMLYFKPPGARGQALHQDQWYLRAYPGTCMAAWLALDACDEENGCLLVVPGSHKLPILCTEQADVDESFTDVTVPMPPDSEAVPIVMEPGDVLFFHGNLIHGSLKNRSKNRFRRALIGHYVTGRAERVATFYHPALRFDGSVVPLKTSDGGGPCGVFVVEGGETKVEMASPSSRVGPEHE